MISSKFFETIMTNQQIVFLRVVKKAEKPQFYRLKHHENSWFEFCDLNPIKTDRHKS